MAVEFVSAVCASGIGRSAPLPHPSVIPRGALRVIEIEATDRTTVLVCVTCRTPNDAPDAPRSGMLLAAATADAARDDSDIRVQRVQCLGNCSRGPSAAIRNQRTWTYVFGGLDPLRDGPALVTGARLLASAVDGLMPWRGRPEPLKRGLIARVPPLDFRDDADVEPA